VGLVHWDDGTTPIAEGWPDALVFQVESVPVMRTFCFPVVGSVTVIVPRRPPGPPPLVTEMTIPPGWVGSTVIDFTSSCPQLDMVPIEVPWTVTVIVSSQVRSKSIFNEVGLGPEDDPEMLPVLEAGVLVLVLVLEAGVLVLEAGVLDEEEEDEKTTIKTITITKTTRAIPPNIRYFFFIFFIRERKKYYIYTCVGSLLTL
jgi:hypothetical protein